MKYYYLMKDFNVYEDCNVAIFMDGTNRIHCRNNIYNKEDILAIGSLENICTHFYIVKKGKKQPDFFTTSYEHFIWLINDHWKSVIGEGFGSYDEYNGTEYKVHKICKYNFKKGELELL